MKTSPIHPRLVVAIVSLFACTAGLRGQGTAFTYQGRLNDGGVPANGTYDLLLTIYDLPTGSGAFASQTNSAMAISNGLFTVTLDFGPGIFTGEDRWLEIAVRTNGGGAFTNLSPRQRITATPYAITAGNLNGSINAGQLSGTIPLAQLPAAVVTNNQSGVNFTGTFAGNGAGVTNVSILTLNSFGSITWPGTFVLASSPGGGSYPQSVTATDVNGDGRADLISANINANTLSVLTNNGSGAFALASSPGVGGEPYSVTAVDVNGDGKADLISANSGSSTLSVLTNNGNGGFVLSSSPGVGSIPYSVTAADVNGDGKVDLISANRLGNNLSVLTNNGSGGFALSSSPGVGSFPESVAAADINGDGKVDLISANNASLGTLTVLTNNGSGSFVLSSSPVVGNRPVSVTAADVNGDGKMDLVSANAFGNTLTVLTNNGGGGFVLSSSPGVGSGPVSVTAADVNGDGKVDLISANYDDNTLSVLTNNGSGGFVRASLPGVGGGPASVTAADVNGDGKVDLISANNFGNALSVLFNAPTFAGNFSGSGAGLTSLNTTNLTGTIADARLSANVALLNANQTFTGLNVFTNSVGIGVGAPSEKLHVAGNILASSNITANGNMAIAAPGTLSFGSSTRQMITLYGGDLHGIGVQNSTTYFRSSSRFSWFANGVHANGENDPGAGGETLMTLDSTGLNVSRVKLEANPNGAIELGPSSSVGATPFIDFHYGFGSAQDYNVRLINDGTEQLTIARFGSGTPLARFSPAGLTVNGAFVSVSDRNAKQDFKPVSNREVLEKVAALPITRWSFKEDATSEHIGPMAQDFYAAFSLGTDDKHIATVDADGVALAAIQGLNQKLTEELKRRDAENADLKARLSALEKLVADLNSKGN